MKFNHKISVFFLICMTMLVSSLALAWADTDYRCLTLCINGGKTESVCMPQCSHDDEVKPIPKVSSYLLAPQTSPKPTNHKILAPLLPANNDPDHSSSEKPASPTYETKDYQCLSQCFQNQMQYDTCEKNCTIVKSENGTALTTKSNLINNLNAAPAPLKH